MDWRRGFTTEASVRSQPVRVVFGAGALEAVANEAVALGSPVLVIAGTHHDDAATAVERGLEDAFAGRIRDLVQHVPEDLARRARERFRSSGAGCVVAIGGGSAIGLAKAIALEAEAPVLAVPTTYSGSEMTPIWGLTSGEGKRTGTDLRVLPRTVVYDPELGLTLPRELGAASGLNAVAHALEALYSPEAERPPDADDLMDRASRALQVLLTALPALAEHPDDRDARAEALGGSWLAGWALGSATMGLQHKLAHVLGGRFGLPHAETHGVLLPQVAAATVPGAPRAFAAAAAACGVETAAAVPAALHDLARGLDAPLTLRDLGLRRSAFPEVVRTVTQADVRHPVPVTAQLVGRIMDDAWAGRRPS